VRTFFFRFFRNRDYLPVIPTHFEGRTRRHERESGCNGRGWRRSTSDATADGEAVWSQCRRFEVPAEAAANVRQELQIESGTGEFRVSSALCFPKFATEVAAITRELRKAGTSRPKAGAKFAATNPQATETTTPGLREERGGNR